MIELRPAKYLLGRLAPMDNNDKIPQFNLGAGTYNSTVFLRGDGVWADPLAAGFVPTSRTLTINGVTYDLSANRTWTIDKASVGLGNVDNTSDANKPISTATQTALNLKEDKANKGVPNGYASLAGDGKVPSTQLPSYVDDVIEVANYAALPTIGETGVIYITLDNNNVYRWSGSVYVQISQPNAVWGSITGTLSNQVDLQAALNAKQNNITLTTTGTSGAATLIGATLNIPRYDSSLIGYVPYTGATGNVNLGEYGLSAGWVQIDTTPTTYTPGVGKLGWNDQDGTLEFQLLGGNVTLQIGQEQVARVVNKTDPSIDLLESNYQVVKITGAQGNRLKVALAQANNDANSAETLGIVTETIPHNQEGFITTSGLVKNINTTGSLQGETWADGDMLYLSGTVAGKITKVKPSAPIHTVILGYVVRAHATQGQIYVKVDNGYELGELHDVNTTISKTTPIDTDSVLLQDTADSNIWKKLSWLNTKATLKTYFDTLYQAIGSYVPTSRTITINGNSQDLSANRTYNVGTVTSVGLSAPTGFSISNSPVTGSGTIGLSFASGYSLPTDSSQSNWNQAFNDKINSASVTGTTTKTLTLNQQDGGTITASWTDDNTDAVSSVFGRTGVVVAVSGDYNTSQVTESTNLYYTEARVNANANVAANTAARHNAVTLGTANGLSLSTQQLSLGLASASTTGALSSTDWNTFNNKQNTITNPITGTGTLNYIPKFTGSGSIGNSLIFDNGTNVGIGTTNPSEKLTVQGNIYASQGGFIAYRTDGGTGIDVNGGDLGSGSYIARFKNYSNVDQLVIKGNGNVGIGTTTPSTKIDVYSTENGNWTTTFINGSTGGHQIYTGYNNGTTRYGVYIQGGGNDANSYDLLVSGNKFAVVGNGNVGIGTGNPFGIWSGDNRTLQINSGTNTSSELVQSRTGATISRFLSGTSDEFGVYTNSALNYTIYTNGSERIRIAANGNVGIGTTNPNRKLTVSGEISSNYGSNQGALWLGEVVNQVASFTSYGILDFTLHHGSGYADIMRIQGNGNVGIGTTAPAAKLDINANNGIAQIVRQTYSFNGPNYAIGIVGDGASAGYISQNPADGGLQLSGGTTYYGAGLWRTDTTSGSTIQLINGNTIFLNNGGLSGNYFATERMRISSDGNIGIGTAAPDPSAIVDLTSTTQGFLPPRMDNSEINAISNPAEGLIVYSTQSKCLFLFDGANWQKIAYA